MVVLARAAYGTNQHATTVPRAAIGRTRLSETIHMRARNRSPSTGKAMISGRDFWMHDGERETCVRVLLDGGSTSALTVLVEADLVSALTEALTADVEAVLADDTALVAADTAVVRRSKSKHEQNAGRTKRSVRKLAYRWRTENETTQSRRVERCRMATDCCRVD